jgi:LmbE family N-acetylglucosaminyl deacetylase
MATMTKGSVIVFSPHPDDETFGCGGTIARRISEGFEVSIVELTDGRFSLRMYGILSDPTPEEMKKVRRREVQNVTKILGVKEQNLVFLDFEDGSLTLNEISAEAKISSIFRHMQPSEVFFPSSKDVHPDHQVTNRLVRSAIAKSGKIMSKYEYSINSSFPRINLMLDSFMNLFTHRTLRVDISEFLDLKKTALNEYRSQIALISSKQKKPALSSSFLNMHLKEHELFYKA